MNPPLAVVIEVDATNLQSSARGAFGASLLSAFARVTWSGKSSGTGAYVVRYSNFGIARGECAPAGLCPCS